jgi:hypothetical protein
MSLELLYFPRNVFSPRYGHSFFTYAITGYHSVNDGCCNSKQYVVYEIRVTNGDKTWMVYRRFSEFYELGRFFIDSKHLNITLPSKTLCRPTIGDEEFLNHRLEKLDGFLDELLRSLAVSSKRNVLALKEVVSFLRLQKEV